MTTNFNTEPYNDDYSEDSKFYRILFRPSFAVQARELTQLQTILQNQIQRHGDAIFKQGAMVIPGQVSIDTKSDFVKLTTSYNGSVTESFIQSATGKFVTGASGIKAQIIKVSSSTATDPTTLFVKYLSSNTVAYTDVYGNLNPVGTQNVFADGEVINFDDGSLNSIQSISLLGATTAQATGKGSLASIARGVYYVNGFFVLCADPVTFGTQTIVLDPYDSMPSYRIGLKVNETLIIPEDDVTLLDNAQTSYNYAAPGAHRYHIDLILSKLPLDSTDDENFIELLKVDNGQIVRIVNTTQYSVLEDELARRTYDEAGNYTVTPFQIDVREARNNNRGLWTSGQTILLGDVVNYNGNYYTSVTVTPTTTVSVPPVHTSGFAYDGTGSTGVRWQYTPNPIFNRGISLNGSADQLAIGLEPGKAYVSGYEITKVATEYVYIDKTRDSSHQVQVTAATIPQTVGNYALVDGLNFVPPVDTFDDVTLYNQYTVRGSKTVTLTGTITTTTSSTSVTGSGTSFTTQLAVGSVIYSGTTYVGTVASIASNTSLTLTTNATTAITGGTVTTTGQGFQPSGTAVGTARVRAIELDNGTYGSNAAQYKVMLFDIEMNAGYTFSHDVKSFYYAGSSPAVTFTADVVPTLTQLIGSATASSSTTITGSGTSFQSQLAVGDYIQFGATGIVRRVTGISSQQSITVDASTTVTADSINKITSTILEPQNESLIFQLPYYAVKSVRAADGTNRIIYTSYQKFTGNTSSGSGGSCTLTVSASAGTMISSAQYDNYQLIDNTTGLTVNIAGSNIAVSGSSVTFTLSSSYASRAFTVIGAVTKTLSSATEKTKTLVTTDGISGNPSPITFTTKATAQNPTLYLNHADGYKVISILMDAGGFGSPTGNYTIDISDRYTFNDGQTAFAYEQAYLQLLPAYAPPSGPVQVIYQYFAHGTGDYFTVNSYSTIDYKLIPFFGSAALRDCIDFRPRTDTTGNAYTGSDGSVSLVPKRGINIEADFSYYLARTDKIAIDRNGNFFQIKGTPSLIPGDPADPNLGMLLYTLNLEPYVFSTSSTSVVVNKTENKRYTMRDIGKLETRINTLEYYTSLSLLETQVQATAINDPNTGLVMYKNGFVVDNFSGHSAGDVQNPDYFCSIDMQNNILRPFYSMQDVNLIEKNTTTAQRTSSNYQISGNLITLPVVSENVLISQPYGSRLENINPFSIFTFLGQVNMNPSTDNWFEVNRRPDIINNVMGDFNTIATLAEKAGVLGTVWNAWQTQWTGSPVSTGQTTYVADQRGIGVASWRDGTVSNTSAEQVQAMFGNGPQSALGGWAHRQVTTESFATQVGQSRTGVNTQVVSTIDTQLVNDSVLSQAVIPYIRSRNILVQATGLKPLTQLFPFFDQQSIDAYCTPATKISYALNSGTFDSSSNVGSGQTAAARLIAGDSQVCLNVGDVITGGTSGATAVVVGNEVVLDTNNNVSSRNLYVVNIIGTFQANEVITGSISSASANINSVGTIKTAGSSLITDINGKVQFLFNIPNTTSLAFRTGQRILMLTDDSTNGINYTTRGQNTYYAQGILQTKQATYNAIQNGQIVATQVSDNQTITQTSSRVVSDTGWYDPLAETFLISNTGGAFLTKVDLYFATKSQNMPVHIEIREVVNGYPGTNILPFSRVALNPEDVKISTNLVQMPDGSYAPSYDTPTTFHFPSPVYVNDATSYALVVASDSNGYKVWCAGMGDQIPGSSRTISAQPYNGVLFKSQNGSTWTASQDEDLMFNIYYAQFPTDTVATVQFVNDQLPHVTLPLNPIQTNTGSAKIKVTHPNHGLPANSYVTLTNSDNTVLYGTTATGTITCSTGTTAVVGSGTSFNTLIGTGTNGAGAVLWGPNNTYIGVVASVTDNTHLTLVSNASHTYGSASAFNVAKSINGIPPTEIYKSSQVAVVVDQNTYIINTTTAATVFGYSGSTNVSAVGHVAYNALQPSANVQTFPDTNVNYSVKTITGTSINGVEAPYVADANFNGVVINDTNYFPAPRMIASQQNESSLLAGNKSVSFQCQMSTNNPSLSPVLDTTRMSLIAISNVQNNPSYTVTNQSGIDSITVVSGNTNIAVTSTGISSSDTATKAALANLAVGKYITISGATTHTVNNQTAMITAVASDGSSVTLNSGTLSAQTAGDTITLTLLNAYVDDIAPTGSSTHSSYITKKINLNKPATTLKITVSANSSTNSNLLVYYKINPAGASASAYSGINYVLASPDSPLPKVQYGDNTYTDVTYTLNGLSPFDAFTVKLVFTSSNMSEVTYCKDLRIIATS